MVRQSNCGDIRCSNMISLITVLDANRVLCKYMYATSIWVVTVPHCYSTLTAIESGRSRKKVEQQLLWFFICSHYDTQWRRSRSNLNSIARVADATWPVADTPIHQLHGRQRRDKDADHDNHNRSWHCHPLSMLPSFWTGKTQSLEAQNALCHRHCRYTSLSWFEGQDPPTATRWTRHSQITNSSLSLSLYCHCFLPFPTATGLANGKQCRCRELLTPLIAHS